MRYPTPSLPTALLAVLTPLVVLPAQQSALPPNSVSIRVTVVSAVTHSPIAGATLRLRTVPEASVVTDSTGRAAFIGVPKRLEGVEATHVGFRPRTEVLLLAALDTDDVSITLSLKPDGATQLDPVAVTAAAPSKAPGFEARREVGRGYLFDRAAIDKVKPRSTTELLRRVPGLRVETWGSQVRIRSRRAGDCEMLLYLDGSPVFNEMTPLLTRGVQSSRPTPVPSVIDRIPPGMIEAVEVYLGPSETPPEYSRGGANCGAIVIWTRSAR